MGDVYRAKDTRLDRTVAIKVLSAEIAGDPLFRDRFEREARAVAALNHPHICTLHDIGHDDSAGHFLVMELVEGETLASRLARGPVPLAQALQYACQIASALDAAHRAGIVHRDLKPGNVMLTKAGAKLLDFGLATQAAALGAADRTSTGLVLGTIQYMAPEQLEGRPADARTDIFAFGATVSEMLTGKRVFDGGTQGAVATAILQHDPTQLARLSAPALDRAVKKCLARDPDDRWQSAGDLASELEWIAHGGAGSAEPAEARRLARTQVRERAAWILAALLALTAGAVLMFRSAGPPPVRPVKRFAVSFPNLEPLSREGARFGSLFRDGSGVVYYGGAGNELAIQVHTWADGVSRPIPGTEGAGSIFVSPDGKWIGFVQGGRLKKVAATPGGGLPVTIGEGVSVRPGAVWSAGDQIVYGTTTGLWRVPAADGTPVALTTLAEGEAWHITPEILPGEKTVLFTVLSRTGAQDDAFVAAVSIATGERRVLIKNAASARYSKTGHLLYIRGSDLLAVPFDPERLVMGASSVVQAGVRVTPQYLHGHFDFSDDGTLLFLPSVAVERSLVWIDRTGTTRPVPVPLRAYAHISLQPDERSAIVEIEGTPHSLAHLDLVTGVLTSLTAEGANHRPVQSSDGRWIVFASDRTVPRSLFRQATDGSGKPERLLEAKEPQNPTSWSRDGHWLAYTESGKTTREDIWVLPMEGERTPKAFLNSPAAEDSAAFSPDGRWIAYVSDGSGKRQVMVSGFPGPGPFKQVSTAGGNTPVFSPDGRTLFYRQRDQLLEVDFAAEPALHVSAPRVAFDALPGPYDFIGLANFAVNRKGDALLVVKESDPRVVQVITNWFDRLTPAAPPR